MNTALLNRRNVITIAVVFALLLAALIALPVTSKSTSSPTTTPDPSVVWSSAEDAEHALGLDGENENVFGVDLAAASAGNCTLPGVCGKIFNKSSTWSLTVIHNWGETASYYRSLPPRQYASSYFGWVDTDGFYVQAGWCADVHYGTGGEFLYRVGSGAHKITDTTWVRGIYRWDC